MTTVDQREILTQQVVRFFQDALDYTYLGCWKERSDISNVEEGFLTAG